MTRGREVVKRFCTAAALSLLAATHSLLGAQHIGEADVVYKNGFVYTVDAVASRAQAFAVGTNDEMTAVSGKNTKVVDLEGKMVIPGIVDGHIHPVRGALTKLGVNFEQRAVPDGE